MYSQLRRYGWRPLQAVGHVTLALALLVFGLALERAPAVTAEL
jgi:hypothetical protein